MYHVVGSGRVAGAGRAGHHVASSRQAGEVTGGGGAGGLSS
jgi:hypothetical protein